MWKVEETSPDGCTFLCPQLQSFNTSLPHQFVNTSQATTIVDHRCHISQQLETTITLNQKLIKGKIFTEFERDKQVGPLLDWVASLRLCIGYPDVKLVEQARYLKEKKIFLPPQISKLLNFVKIVFTPFGKPESNTMSQPKSKSPKVRNWVTWVGRLGHMHLP